MWQWQGVAACVHMAVNFETVNFTVYICDRSDDDVIEHGSV
uniref:Uncharacterized protein n=1 Tax=Anopheles atroparvus TaxID=41427 RepID=A0AAG5DRD1_ANOAO